MIEIHGIKDTEDEQKKDYYMALDFKLNEEKNGLIVTGADNFEDEIIIPSEALIEGVSYPVMEIAESAFSNCHQLSKVILPFSLRKIGNKAFNKCDGLKEVMFSEGLETIGEEAFEFCNLRNLLLPKSVKEIGKQAFCFNKNLQTIIIPFTLNHIGDLAFGRAKVEFIDNYGVIYSTDRKTIVKAFYSLEDYVIPDGVETIANYAFKKKLKGEVTLPISVKTIGEKAFAGCVDLILKVPTTVEHIGNNAFDKIHYLSYVGKLEAGRPWGASEISNVADTWKDGAGVLYSADKKTLIRAPESLNRTAYVIPEGTEIICDRAFCGCFTIGGTITIAKSVRWIGSNAFTHNSRGLTINMLGEVNGYPWGAKRMYKKNPEKKDKPHEVYGISWDRGKYYGTVVNGIPNGRGALFDVYGMTPRCDGLWENGEFVSGDIFDVHGNKYKYNGPCPDNGYGSGFYNGKYYTGNWVNGYPEEEWDELWHDIT